MVKAYLRYEPVAALGCITSGSTILYSKEGNQIYTAALEKVAIWNARTGELVKNLSPVVTGKRLPEVTSLALSPEGQNLAVGHSDGSLRIWNVETGDSEPPASGHRSGISALRYSRNGALLASGGQDTSIVIWDITGLFPINRLQGHTGQITSLVFLEQDKVILSSSKDGYIRAWDLSSQHCFQTLSSHHGEVWGLDINPDGSKIVAGYSSPQIELFNVQTQKKDSQTNERSILQSLGTIPKSTPDRVSGIFFSPGGQVVACVGAKSIELLRLRSEGEALQKLKRRRKRKRDKLTKDEENQENESNEENLIAADYLGPFQIIRCKSKVKAAAFVPKKARIDSVHIGIALGNNSVEIWTASEENSERVNSIDSMGHRSGVRALALSPDNSLLITAGESSLKVWNPNNLVCIRDIAVNNGLCLMFAPGNRHVVVGTKSGSMELVDINAGEIISSLEAHKGAIWAVTPLPDNSGLVSGSADHEAKFWEWEVKEEVQKEAQPKRTLSLGFVRSLTMSDDVLAIKISPDARLIAVSLLDSTIQIHFLDTLKLKGSLYGHKLPVLTMDISSDSTILVSGSADKNLKIWGLDFNDCHKSIFAHDDSIMQVAFVPETHYVFSVGKDRMVKYWDMDRWELLLELPSHHAEVWCLAISNLGDMVITGSADRSIRIWERTDEPFFAEEERETRIESLFEIEEPNPRAQLKPDESNGPIEGKSLIAGLETVSARNAMDNLADSLDKAAEERKRLEEYQAQHPGGSAPTNPLLLGLNPTQYVLKSLSSIRSADLEQALLLLPFSFALDLLEYLCYWLEKGMKVELSCRVAVLLVRLHHNQLVSTPSVRPILLRTKELLQREIKKKKESLSFNAAGASFLLRLLKQNQTRLPSY